MTTMNKAAFTPKDMLSAAYATVAGLPPQERDDAAQEFCLYALDAARRAKEGKAIKAFQWAYGRGGVSKHIVRSKQWASRERSILQAADEDGKQCFEAVYKAETTLNMMVAEETKALTSARLRDSLQELPERSRKVIEMRFFHDMTLTQIAESMSLTKERVRQMEAAALVKLRIKMEKQ